jgi:hypothetical protein
VNISHYKAHTSNVSIILGSISVGLSCMVDEDYTMHDKEEDDVMGLLFTANTSNNNFMPLIP